MSSGQRQARRNHSPPGPFSSERILEWQITLHSNMFCQAYRLCKRRRFSQHCQFLTRLVGEKKQLGFFVVVVVVALLLFWIFSCVIAISPIRTAVINLQILQSNLFFFCSATMQKSGIQRARDIVEISFEGDTCESFFLRRKI